MKKLILILSVVLLAAVFMSADVYIKQKTHTDAMEMMGQKQPAKDAISELWLGDGKMATVSGKTNMVLDLKNKKMYYVFHDKKSYFETTLPLDTAKILPPQAAQMMAGTKMAASVKANGKTKKIGTWNCTGYDVVLDITTPMMPMKMNMAIWASSEVPFDWKAFRDNMAPGLLKAQMASLGMNDEAIEAFKKIDGYQVGMDMNMTVMGAKIHTTMEVVEIAKKAAPAGTYAPPAGYTKTDKMPNRGMGGM